MCYDELFQSLKDRVYEKLDPSIIPDDKSLVPIIDELLLEDVDFSTLNVIERVGLKNAVYNSIKGLDILSDLIVDDDITEIMVNGYDKVFIEKRGQLERTKYKFESEDRLFEVIQRIMAKGNRVVNESSPIVDTRLSDGSRVNIVLEPISLNGSTLTIRKFPKEVMSIKRLIEYKSIDEEIAGFLKKIVEAGYNIFISGATSSGKTSMLNALAQLIPKNERLITIEDSAELQIDGLDNLVRMEVRSANSEGGNVVSIRDLIKASLRMRPNRILVGEVRGEEAIEMLQAMNTGHDGSISTGHANSARDMISRLETMVIMGIDMPLMAVRSQIASAIEVIVHLGRLSNGKRALLEVQEVVGMEDEKISLNMLYKYNSMEDRIVKVNEMKNISKLEGLNA